MGGISRRGDPATRRVLVIAATVLLSGTQQWNSLKAWGVRLAKRIRAVCIYADLYPAFST